MAVKRYNGTSWDNVAGLGAQGATGAAGASATTVVTTKGDLLTYDTTTARIGVGANNTVLTADSSTATGLKWAAAGKVLQVIQDVVVGEVTTTSSSFVDTGLDVTITPATTGSRIMLTATLGNLAKGTGNVNTSIALEIVRGSTRVYYGTDTCLFNNVNGPMYIGPISFSFVDSPATTSATTYKVRFAGYISGQTITINKNGSDGSNTIQSTLIATEIGA